MYAPGTYDSGSSISHWSITATPDLLMKPGIGDLEFADVDITAAAMRDIGWSVNVPAGSLDEILRDGFE